MKEFTKVSIGSFLVERTKRFKPSQANELKLSRIEKIDFNGNIHLVPHKQTNTNMILIKKGDLVISGINVEKGAISVYKGDDDVTATIHYSSYEFDENKIDIDFLKWFLKSNSFKKILSEAAGGGIKTELKAKNFLQLEIYLPDLSIQREIVQKLESVKDEIENISKLTQENYNLLLNLRNSILQDAIHGKLVPQDENDEPARELLENTKIKKELLIKEKKIKKEKTLPQITDKEKPYELPNGWEWVRLGELGTVQGGATPSKGNPSFWKGDIPWISPKDMKKKYIVNSIDKITEDALIKTSSLKLIPTNSLLFVVRGMILAHSFPVSINKIAVGTNQDMKSLTPYNENIINFLYYVILAEKGRILKLIERSTHGTCRLETEKLLSTLIPIPPLNEQKRIVEKVDQLMALCDDLEQSVEQTKQESEKLMKAVLQEAFSVKEQVFS
jgi:restriction endonuclease S subunit